MTKPRPQDSPRARRRASPAWVGVAVLLSCTTMKYSKSYEPPPPVTTRTFADPELITAGSESNYAPELSPNGAFLFFTSERTGNKNIFEKRVDGGYLRQLTDQPADSFSPAVSPDGKRIAFVSRRNDAAGDVHFMALGATFSSALGGEGDVGVFDLKASEDGNPVWMPDGQRIVFIARPPSAELPQVMMGDTKTGKVSPLENVQGIQPMPSPDGQYLAYARKGALFLYRFADKQSWQLTLGGLEQDGLPAFTPKGDALYFIRYADDTNHDGKIDADDRPSLWHLPLKPEEWPKLAQNPFAALPITSARYAAYYPRPKPPYLYFSIQNDASLDIFRLPEAGHYPWPEAKDGESVVATFPEDLTRVEDMAYFLRRQAAAQARQGHGGNVARQALRELHWHASQGRGAEARALRAKIKVAFADDAPANALADVMELRGRILARLFPANTGDLSGRDAELLGALETKSAAAAQASGAWAGWARGFDALLRAEGQASRRQYFPAIATVDEALKATDLPPFLAGDLKLLKARLIREVSDAATGIKQLASFIEANGGDAELSRKAADVLLDAAAAGQENPVEAYTMVKDTYAKLDWLPAMAHQRIVDAYVAQRKTDVATNELRQLVSAYPNSPETVLPAAERLARLEEEAGRHDAVEKILIRLVDAMGRHPNPKHKQRAVKILIGHYLRHGESLLRGKEPGLAIKVLTKATALAPDDVAANKGIIDALHARKRIEEVIAARKKTAEAQPHNGKALYFYGYALTYRVDAAKTPRERLAAIEAALEPVLAARARDPNEAAINQTLGWLYFQKHVWLAKRDEQGGTLNFLEKRWRITRDFFGFRDPVWLELALDSYIAAYTLSPPDSIERANLAQNLGETYYELKNHAKALRYYALRIDQARTLPFRSAEAEAVILHKAGRSALQAEEYPLAQQFFTRAIAAWASLKNDNEVNRNTDLLALAHRDAQDWPTAAKLYGELHQAHLRRKDKPNAAAALVNQAFCLQKMKDNKGALALYADAKALLDDKAGDGPASGAAGEDGGIAVDLGGQGSAAQGFDADARRIQIASAETDIYVALGNQHLARESVRAKIALQKAKREAGIKAGRGKAYYAEELATSTNNLAAMQAAEGKTAEAMASYREAVAWAEAMGKDAAVPPRDVWLNVISHGRMALRRAVFPTGPQARDPAAAKAELREAHDFVQGYVAKVEGAPRPLPGDGNAFLARAVPLLTQMKALLGDATGLAQPLMAEGLAASVATPDPELAPPYLASLSSPQGEAWADSKAALADAKRRTANNAAARWKWFMAQGLFREALADVESQLETKSYQPSDRELAVYGRLAAHAYRGLPATGTARVMFAQAYARRVARAHAKRLFPQDEDAWRALDPALTPLAADALAQGMGPDEAILMVMPTGVGRWDAFLLPDPAPFPVSDASGLAAALAARLNGKRHLYVVGHADFPALGEAAARLRADGALGSWSYVIHPGQVPHAAKARSLARAAFVEVAAPGAGARKAASAFSYRAVPRLAGLPAPSHVIYQASPVFYAPQNPAQFTFGTGPQSGADDVTGREAARAGGAKPYAMVIGSVRPYAGKTGPNADLWPLWRNLLLVDLSLQVPTTIVFTGESAPEEDALRPVLTRLADDSMADALRGIALPHVVLGSGGLTLAQETDVARARLAETFEKGDPAEALRYAQLLKDEEKVGQLLLTLREQRLKAFDPDAALFYQEKILARTSDLRDRADEWLTAGGLAIQAKEFAKAKDYLAQAEAVYAKEQDNAQLGQTYKFVALMRQGQQDYRGTIAAFEASRKAHLADDDKGNAAQRLLDIANIHNLFLNDYATALDYYAKAEGEYLAAEDADGVERVQIDKANTLMTIGQTKEAIQILAALLAKVDRDEDPVKWVRTAQILSNAYFRAALYHDASALNEEILAETDNFADEKAKATYGLDASNLKAMITAKLGDFPAAMKIFEAGIEPAKRFDLKGKLGQRLNNMGYWAREYGQVDASIAYLNDALALDSARKSDADIAFDLRNLGLSHVMKGNLGQAKALLTDALKLSNKLNITYNAAYAEFGLGDVALRENKLDAALRHFSGTLAMAQKAFLQDFVWRAYASLAWTHEKRGDEAQARAHYQKAVETIESLRAGLSSQSSRSGFQSDKGVQEVYGDYVALLMRTGDAEAAWRMSERSRARAFIDSLANQDLAVADPAKRALVAAEKTARNRRELAERKWTLTPDASPEKAVAAADWEAARAAHAEALRQLAEADPNLAQTVAVDPVALGELAKLLPAGTALVEYMLHKDRIFVWVLRDGRLSHRTVERDVAKLAKDVETFRLLLQSYSATGFIGSDLSAALLDPVKPLIAGAKRLAIVPHGALHYLSFAALPYEGAYLLDAFPLSYLESATVARFTHRGGNTPYGPASKVLALGNPDVGKDLDLPFAAKEAGVIDRFFPGTKALIGAAATETAFRSQVTQPFGIVHVASHGVFDEATPGNSALVLAKDDANDGMLRVTEVFGLRIPADLTVLSACETGLGKLSSGDEIVGLNRALFYAGTRSVVSSLWRINDVASAVVVKRLYRNLAQGTDRDESLRRAQLLVRQYYPHPAYWAAFRLLGHY